jgi:nitroreductase
MIDIDVAQADRLLTTTRAVRRRLDLARPVPADVVTDAVRVAVQAPSAGDVQAWRWVAVADPGRRRAIADVQRASNDAYLRRALEASRSDGERRRLSSALHLLDHLHEVPVLVLAYTLVGGEGADEGGVELPPAALWGSIFPAVWSFQLALRARGLGTTPLFVEDEAGVARVVGAPAGARLASLMPVAYTTGDTFRPATRRPLGEVLGWDGWPGAAP